MTYPVMDKAHYSDLPSVITNDAEEAKVLEYMVYLATNLEKIEFAARNPLISEEEKNKQLDMYKLGMRKYNTYDAMIDEWRKNK